MDQEMIKAIRELTAILTIISGQYDELISMVTDVSEEELD
jgi:hypothetical protein